MQTAASRKSRGIKCYYRCWSLSASFLLLGGAFAAKFYTGPFTWLADRYLGDFFIVGWLYFGLGAMAPRLASTPKAGIIFGLASVIELFQATGIFASPETPKILAFWIGTTFDPWDFIPYALGTLLAMGIDVALKKQTSR